MHSPLFRKLAEHLPHDHRTVDLHLRGLLFDGVATVRSARHSRLESFDPRHRGHTGRLVCALQDHGSQRGLSTGLGSIFHSARIVHGTLLSEAMTLAGTEDDLSSKRLNRVALEKSPNI